MPFITQGKANLKYILIVVILAAIVGGGILAYQYWWAAKKETKMPEIKLPADETADWNTYKNEEYGFEFKYPTEWTSKEPEKSAIHFESPPTTSGFICNIYVENRNNQTIQQWIKKDPNRYTVIKNITVDGASGLIVEDTYTEGGPYNVAIFPYGDYMILVGYASPSIEQLEKILSTFKFLDGEVISPNVFNFSKLPQAESLDINLNVSGLSLQPTTPSADDASYLSTLYGPNNYETHRTGKYYEQLLPSGTSPSSAGGILMSQLRNMGWNEQLLQNDDVMLSGPAAGGPCGGVDSMIGYKNDKIRFVSISYSWNPCTGDDGSQNYFEGQPVGENYKIFISDLIDVNNLVSEFNSRP